MLDFFRLPKDGPHYRRLVQGFTRIFGATIFFGTEQKPGGAALIDWARFHFFDRMKLWFNRDREGDASPAEQRDNAILLSQAFYREIDEHRIFVERGVITALAHAPGALDFYIWLVWKSWTVNGSEARIALTHKAGLQEQLGVVEYRVERSFRLTIRRWLRLVHALWPECPASISNDGHSLIVRSSKSAPAIRF